MAIYLVSLKIIRMTIFARVVMMSSPAKLYVPFLFIFAGVAYSKHMMQLYRYHGGNDIRQHLEVSSMLIFSCKVYESFLLYLSLSFFYLFLFFIIFLFKFF